MQLKKNIQFLTSASAGMMFLLFCMAVLLLSCETEIDLNLPDPDPKIVVEGYIENGRQPFVLLTRNAPYYGDIDLNNPDAYVVRGATVIVSHNGNEEILNEVCLQDLQDLPEIIRNQILNEMGIPVSTVGDIPNLCFYTAINPQIIGQVGEHYDLKVIVDNKVITARTKIPDLLTLDSIWYQSHDNPALDSLFILYGQYTDPDTIGNYVRYSSKRNKEPFYGLWVVDDRLVNGQTIVLPLRRGESRFTDFDINTFGYFSLGDTVIVRWAAIDKAHFDFWNTMDFEMVPSGPFTSPTVIKSNIEGGLGIWGGYAAFYDTLVITGN